MNKNSRVVLGLGAAALAMLALDRFFVIKGKLPSSPLRMIPQTWQDPAIWQSNARGQMFMLVVAYLFAGLIGFTFAWTFSVSAQEKEELQRRAIAEEVIDEAVKRVKKDLPMSPQVEQSVVGRFWARIERAFGMKA